MASLDGHCSFKIFVIAGNGLTERIKMQDIIDELLLLAEEYKTASTDRKKEIDIFVCFAQSEMDHMLTSLRNILSPEEYARLCKDCGRAAVGPVDLSGLY